MRPLTYPLHIVIVTGSVRPDSNTGRTVAVLEQALSRRDDIRVTVVDPSAFDLRLPGLGSTDDARRLQQLIKDADGVILTTPEYHGSYSSVIKLVIDNLGFPSALKGKPVGLLGVASGKIGAIKALEHLRSVASHVGAIVLPGPVSISGVRSEFDEQGSLRNPETERQILSVPDRLIDYIRTHICPAITLEALVRGDISPEGLRER